MVTGNVVKFGRTICVVSRSSNDGRLELVPLDCSDRLITTGVGGIEVTECECNGLDYECGECDGVGELEVSYARIEYVAGTVYDYIVKSFLKNFDLNRQAWQPY